MWNADLGWDGLCGSALPLEGSNIPSFNSKVWAFCADLGDGILGGLLKGGPEGNASSSPVKTVEVVFLATRN